MTRKAKCILAIVVLVCSVIGFCASMPMPMQSVRIYYYSGGWSVLDYEVEVFSNGIIQTKVLQDVEGISIRCPVPWPSERRQKLSQADRACVDYLITQVKENAKFTGDCGCSDAWEIYVTVDDVTYEECYGCIRSDAWVCALAEKVADVAPVVWNYVYHSEPWSTSCMQSDNYKELWATPKN